MEGCMSSLIGNGPVEFSKGFEKLLEEHVSLRQQLEALLQMVQLLNQQEEKAEVFADLRKKVSAFFKELEAHSQKEESILFPMLETYIGKSGGPIAVMEYEHEEAKRLIQSFLTQSDKETMEENMVTHSLLIREAHSLLISHFMKEENVLFPMGERLFSESEKEELYVKVAG
ncbi:hemerythrin domain-containing protein [Niallia endozanthoxylica]|uniref:Hemerythrin domain-containing protein n=1 Tax=Niallia endozanthoxylica TaxID=2036016 RepID=A0A5J5HU40_9BACI|nr:hemerythrin domain-containing protein [Niallia endozanthoxylica]KAA9026059.1 hemerythrin domain-containing protein [Niallia endozanthoxylica]